MSSLDDWLDEKPTNAHDWLTDDIVAAYNGPTTDEMDHTTPEDRNKLVAFCNHCEEWWHFVRDMNPTPEEEVCPTCGGKPSNQVGFQLMSERTFNPILHGKKKPKKR